MNGGVKMCFVCVTVTREKEGKRESLNLYHLTAETYPIIEMSRIGGRVFPSQATMSETDETGKWLQKHDAEWVVCYLESLPRWVQVLNYHTVLIITSWGCWVDEVFSGGICCHEGIGLRIIRFPFHSFAFSHAINMSSIDR